MQAEVRKIRFRETELVFWWLVSNLSSRKYFLAWSDYSITFFLPWRNLAWKILVFSGKLSNAEETLVEKMRASSFMWFKLWLSFSSKVDVNFWMKAFKVFLVDAFLFKIESHYCSDFLLDDRTHIELISFNWFGQIDGLDDTNCTIPSNCPKSKKKLWRLPLPIMQFFTFDIAQWVGIEFSKRQVAGSKPGKSFYLQFILETIPKVYLFSTKSSKSTGNGFESQHKLCFHIFYFNSEIFSNIKTPSYEFFDSYGRRRLWPFLACCWWLHARTSKYISLEVALILEKSDIDFLLLLILSSDKLPFHACLFHSIMAMCCSA